MNDASRNQSSKVVVSFSIVSHGQGNLLESLLADFLKANLASYELIITLNLPEDESFLQKFRDLPIRVIRNVERQGFGQNHNGAFRFSCGDIFVIVNPDIRLKIFSTEAMLHCLQTSTTGACAPLVVSTNGTTEDSARRFPSLLVIANRFFTSSAHRLLDYAITNKRITIDWAAGMFVAFKREAYERVKGFDERYFMYYEDADICLRLKYAGYHVELDPSLIVVHDAQRTSRKNFQYLRWHITSALRFSCKQLYFKFLY
jgi:N-acetylglucosaminyl-diphospho-decaprenol L-rhamnosyltransferase